MVEDEAEETGEGYEPVPVDGIKEKFIDYYVNHKGENDGGLEPEVIGFTIL